MKLQEAIPSEMVLEVSKDSCSTQFADFQDKKWMSYLSFQKQLQSEIWFLSGLTSDKL